MAIFEKADPDLKAQRDVESALRSKRRDRDSLNERLGIAEAAIASYRAQARQLAADGADDKEITTAESRMRDSADRCVTLRGAIDDVDKIITGLEREIDQIVDKRCRAETSIAVNAMADELATAQAAFTEAAQKLEAAARASSLIILDGHPVSAFVMSAREQLPPAVEVIVVGLRNHAKAVLTGHAPASLPRPAPEPAEQKVVPFEPMANVFILKNLKYQNKAGVVICLGAKQRHDLPKALAKLALSTRVALPLSDPRIRDLEYCAVAYKPTEAACAWLGPAGRESAPVSMRPGGAVVHSSFEPHPNITGKPYPASMSRPAEPEALPLAAGARNAPDVDEG